jgi:hypothetical protein
MPSVSLKSGRCLLLALLLAPVAMSFCGTLVFAKGTPVTSKSLKIDDSEWTNGEAKQESGRFDALVDKKSKKPVAQSAVPLAEASIYTPSTSPTGVASDAPANGATSEESPSWVWAILGSLFVVGGGLTCFGYYWSNVRRTASW